MLPSEFVQLIVVVGVVVAAVFVAFIFVVVADVVALLAVAAVVQRQICSKARGDDI